jgi:hypothetical protein
MSQGYLIKRKEYKDYTICSKNQSINENDENTSINNNNNNKIIENNNSNFLLLRETKEKETKEGLLRHDSKNLADISRKTMKKKTYLKKHLGGMGTPVFEGGEVPQTTIKKIESDLKGRHKSVNFGNQRGDFFLSSGLLGLKNMNMNAYHGKNSSEYVNDSSKQVFINNKSPFQIHASKFQNEKNKYDDIIKRTSMVNNNENNNTTNLNTVIYNHNTEAVSYLKTIIQSKIKLIVPEGKQDFSLLNQFEKKIKYFEFIKFFFLCNKRKETSIDLIYNFRKRLLSEEHLYKMHINLYLLEKIFQIEDQYKFDLNELYNNL